MPEPYEEVNDSTIDTGKICGILPSRRSQDGFRRHRRLLGSRTHKSDLAAERKKTSVPLPLIEVPSPEPPCPVFQALSARLSPKHLALSEPRWPPGRCAVSPFFQVISWFRLAPCRMNMAMSETDNVPASSPEHAYGADLKFS